MSMVAASALIAVLTAGAAFAADPRACPPPAPAVVRCEAAAPAVGADFTGAVLQVVDGRRLCVALGPTPDRWIAVELADAPAGLPRGALMAAAFGQGVTCTVMGPQRDRFVQATCRLDDVSLAAVAGGAEARAQAASWR